jgi:hypothetical protein
MLEEIQDIQKDSIDNMEPIGAQEKVTESYSDYNKLGGKKRRKSSSKKRGTRSTKKRVVKRKTTRKKSTKKKGPSKWIMHVKAFCKKTGKNFPEALKDPMCRKTFKH